MVEATGHWYMAFLFWHTMPAGLDDLYYKGKRKNKFFKHRLTAGYLLLTNSQENITTLPRPLAGWGENGI